MGWWANIPQKSTPSHDPYENVTLNGIENVQASDLKQLMVHLYSRHFQEQSVMCIDKMWIISLPLQPSPTAEKNCFV